MPQGGLLLQPGAVGLHGSRVWGAPWCGWAGAEGRGQQKNLLLCSWAGQTSHMSARSSDGFQLPNSSIARPKTQAVSSVPCCTDDSVVEEEEDNWAATPLSRSWRCRLSRRPEMGWGWLDNSLFRVTNDASRNTSIPCSWREQSGS